MELRSNAMMNFFFPLLEYSTTPFLQSLRSTALFPHRNHA